MELTVGQINEARSFGDFKGNKWGNERNETNTKGVVPYRFHDQITEQERVVYVQIIQTNKARLHSPLPLAF